MLKPNEIKNYEFKAAGRNAYKADDVDTFFAEVVISYEKVFRENAELSKRIGLLAEKVEQYRKDEVDIKQAVLSAQKAADIIVRDAQQSVEESKAEAEAVLAAAKGEAAVIKQDAEKQAIVDSDLLINLAKDKAEDIINKAKEKAHSILIAANNSASDKMGAANRTITSESLHYDMLKKEVSEFRASILAQYKAHIELISKLPELAVEEAAKVDGAVDDFEQLDISEEELENPVFVEEKSEDSVLEYIDEDVSGADSDETDYDENFDGEEVVKTTLPYDFFADDVELEFVDDGEQVDDAPAVSEDGSIGFSRKNPLPVENNHASIEGDEKPFEETAQDTTATVFEDVSSVSSDDTDVVVNDEDDSGSAVVYSDSSDDTSSILDENDSYSSFFDSIETIDVDDEDEESKPKHKGFFRRNK